MEHGSNLPGTDAPLAHAALRGRPLNEVRRAIRAGRYIGHTAGLAEGHLQANLAILPESLALDFFRFCQRNPKPCPLVGVSDTGDPMMRTMGRDIDVRIDAPAYAVYRDDAMPDFVPDIRDFWSKDHVAFALGCSFTFERALTEAGVAMRHIEMDRTVPMFISGLDTVPAGPFGGGMVVSMRPISENQVDRVREICAEFPHAHGAPVHAGDPAAIGILDIGRPDYGEPVPVKPGEVPVFWACGVTPQNAIRRAAPDLFIAHRPGCMLIADVNERAYPPILHPDGPQHGESQ